MKFWASAETDHLVGSKVNIVRRISEPIINNLLELSSLSKVQLKIRYVPIVMSAHMTRFYCERSASDEKKMVYLCAPVLIYVIFLEGETEDMTVEYFNGIYTSLPHLPKFGITHEQISEFRSLLAVSAERTAHILQEKN